MFAKRWTWDVLRRFYRRSSQRAMHNSNASSGSVRRSKKVLLRRSPRSSRIRFDLMAQPGESVVPAV
jgi:hypothetical protein